MTAKIRPVFCGNFEYDARLPEIERMFIKFGKVDRVDMKTGIMLLLLLLRPQSMNFLCVCVG